MTIRSELHKTLWEVEDVLRDIARTGVEHVSPTYIANEISKSIDDVMECLIHIQSQKEPVKGKLMLRVLCPVHQSVLEEIRGVWLKGLLEQIKDDYWCGKCIERKPVDTEYIEITFEISDEYLKFCKSN